MTKFDDFMGNLAPGACEALAAVGVKSLASLRQQPYGRLCEVIGRDDAERVWRYLRLNMPGPALDMAAAAEGDSERVIQALSRVVDSCESLIVKLDALEKRVQDYEARQTQESTPRPPKVL